MYLKRSIVAIGSFDGVHSGHRMLLQRVAGLAQEHGCRPVAVTFWPHPRQVLDAAGNAPLLLNTFDEKITLLCQNGMDDIVVLPFDRHLSQMSAPDFVRNIVIDRLNAQCLVAGRDHHFGRNRSGDVFHLPTFLAGSGIQMEVVDLKGNGRKVSSSLIRQMLLEGNLQAANDLLGYEYTVSGRVVSGNHLGRTVGFPTANIETPAYKLIPREGVYRVKVSLDATNADSPHSCFSHLGMMYIGKRPVLKQPDATLHIEANIFGFQGQIYGKDITFALTHRIRNDINFDNMQQLAEQLNRDKENILKISS